MERADRVRSLDGRVGRRRVRRDGGGVRLPAVGAGRGLGARGRRDDGECGGHAPAARGAHVDDAAPAGRRPRVGRAARRADGVRAGDLRPVRLRHRDPPADADIDTTRARIAAPPGTDDVRLRLRRIRGGAEACEAVYAAHGAGHGPGCSRGGRAGSGCRCSIRRPSGRAPRRCSACSPSGTARSWAMRGSTTSRSGTTLGPGGLDHAAADRRAGPGGVRGAVALPLRHRPDVALSAPQPAGGRSAAAPRHGRPALRAAGAGRRCTYGWWTWARRSRRGRTRRRWRWCSRSRTPSAPGTRGVGG